jgi:phage tail-like protein
MTQTRDILPLRLQIMPMTLPEAVPQATTQAVVSEMDAMSSSVESLAPIQATGCYLLLYPGEASEILVRLENIGTHPLRLSLQVEGDFPPEWCRIGTEGDLVLPGISEAVLYFQPPADFFEGDVLRTAETLKLDYQGRLHVHYIQEDNQQEYSDSVSFSLYVRPRSLYPEFLPEVFREIDFIGRLLKIFEQAFEPVVHALDSLWAHLDPLTAPQAMLPFLAHWVGWQLHPSFSITRQRYLISRAMELYRWRGTKRGLRFYLHLYTDLPLDEGFPEADKHISIQEVFGQGFVMGNAHIGRDAIMGGGQPYHFIVRLRPSSAHTVDPLLIRQIIDQEKPAFCTYELYIDSISDRTPMTPTPILTNPL